MDIQAALRDGYTKEEVMAELGRRTGMNYQAAINDGYSVDEILTEMSSRAAKAPAPEASGFLARTGANLKKAYTEATTPIYNRGGGMPDTLTQMGEKTLRTAGHLGAVAGDAFIEGAKGLYNLVTDPYQKEAHKSTIAYLANTDIGKAAMRTAGDISEAYKTFKEADPRTAENLEAGANALNLIPAAQLVKAGMPAARLVAGGVADVAGDVATGAARMIRPKPTPEQAMGQVLQSKGKTPGLIAKDIEKGKAALEVIGIDDLIKTTKGKVTYSDISGRIDKAIPEYAAKVDAELMKDTKLYKLDDLSTIKKTKGGTAVETNYVEKAIEHLAELYEKTGDAVKAGNMTELLDKAMTQGLTRKEVNDLARVYGSEFKSFNPTMGTPLTSISSEAYENVRQGLKEVARRGLSDTAKELDSTISSLYNTKRLIDQNASAANKLRQKIDERGLGQKIGRFVWDAIDAATLGIAKGALLKMVPRGMGYKVKNYIDLEESLKRNLKIINAELKRVAAMQPATAMTRPYLVTPRVAAGESGAILATQALREELGSKPTKAHIYQLQKEGRGYY